MSAAELTLWHMRAIREVARCGGFTTAARHLFVSQSSLTRLIKEAERIVGAQLLDRTSRTVVPTPAGLRLLEAIDTVLEVHTSRMSTVDAFLRVEWGVLGLSMLPSVAAVVLPLVLPDLQARHPGLRLSTWDGPADEVLAHLRQGKAEVALTACTGDDEDLTEIPLLRERLVAVSAAPSPWGQRDSVTWQELFDQPLITTRRGTSIRSIVDVTRAAVTGAEGELAAEASTVATVGGLVRSGIGVSVLPALELAGYGLHDLVAVALTEPVAERTLGIVHLAEHSLSPAATVFVAAVRTALRQDARLPAGVQPR
ncbi:LysR family transcriptional regulator [Amycolatopsis sp. NPDC049253]|uniref:LysR family transcriptional regulator n=1 Tax=Amycolatopsis sp. NPDC049253 TaxID=3155274 RepID=UPI0034143528